MKYQLMVVGTVDKGDSLLTRVEKAIKETEATNLKIERLGKKALAYTIKKNKDANYYLVDFEDNGTAIKPITDKLRLEQEDLLRFLLIKNEERKVIGKHKKIVVEEKKVEKVKPKVTVAVRSSASVKSGKDKKEGTTTKTVKTKGKSK